MKRVARTVVGALGLVGCAVVNSPLAAADDSRWYGGVNIGQSRAHIDDARITSGLLGSGLATTSITNDDHHLGYKLFGGLKLNKNFSLEGGYFDLGKFGFTSTTVPAGTLSGDMKIKGLNIDVVGFLPFAEKFSFFGRIGLQYAQVKDSFSGTGAVTVANSSASKNAGNYKIGMGVQYDFTPSLGLRGEFERYRINDAVGNRGDVEMLSVGLVYMFGADKPAPARRAETPPAPPPAAAAAPAAPARITMAMEMEFDPYQDDIKPEYGDELRKVANFMKANPSVTATVQGHAGKFIGKEKVTPKAAMEVSQRRAQRVVDYLVARLDIARSRLSTEAFGQTRRVAYGTTLEGQQENRRVNIVFNYPK